MPETIRIATEEIGKAADILKRGGIVAFPTETVFGLGAIAFDQTAVHRVFQAKGRPNDNPLIAHIADLDQLKLLASDVPVLAMGLMERFWPGCLTIILPKQPSVPDSVTAGLDTVAVRMPSDPLALELIRKAGAPIVAPSANRSGRPSATTWQDVLKDLDGRIDGVVCGPPTSVGLESTVVDATGNWPHVLRHGGIPEADIAQVALEIGLSKPLQDTPQKELSHRSPGTKHRHYQPSAQVVLVNDFNDFLGRSASQQIGRAHV